MAKAPLPVWAQSLIERYSSSLTQSFLVHGNIWDYPAAIPGANLRDYLMNDLTRELGFVKSRDIVLYWDRRGFSFLTDEMKQRFAVAAGLIGQASSGASSRAALMQAAAGLTVETTLEGKLEQQGATPSSAFKLIDKVLRITVEDAQKLFPPKKGEEGQAFRVAVVLGYGEAQAPAANERPSEQDRTSYVILSEWARDLWLGDRGHILFMCVEELKALDDRLRRSSARWEQIAIPYPDQEQRAAFIQEVIRLSGEEVQRDSSLAPIRLTTGFSAQDFARATAGLPYSGLHDIALRARLKDIPIDRALTGERRTEIIAAEYAEVLELSESAIGFDDLGGLEIQKRFLREEVIAPLQAGDRHRVPQGVLFTGPAGVGKSELARAVARESGLLFVNMRVGRLLNMYVGNSERNYERVLDALTFFCPCIAFIDEIHLVFRRGQGRDGDSGIGSRLQARQQEFMADPRWKGKIVWIGATNEPYDLDAAMTRPGRFSIKLPFVVADAQGIAEILEKRVRRTFANLAEGALPEPAVYLDLATYMDGYNNGGTYYTGAEITFMVDKAYSLYYGQGVGWSVAKALEEAYRRTLPTTQEIERMQREALLLANDLDLIPEHLWEQALALRTQKYLDRPPQVAETDDDEGARATKVTRLRRGMNGSEGDNA